MQKPDLRVVRPLVSLKKQAIDRLRNAIIAQQLRPGERLVERELCEMLDVSRTLVREALNQLEVEGLVRIIPHRGPIVAAYTAAETIGIYEVRASLEEMAGRLFVERSSAKEQLALQHALDRIKQAYRDPGNRDRLTIKSEFYLILAEGTHNPVLVEMLRLLHSRVTALRAATLAYPGRAEKALKELTEVVRETKKGDAEAAGKACRRHVENALAVAVEILSQADKPLTASSPRQVSKRRK